MTGVRAFLGMVFSIWAGIASAQEFGALARVDPARTSAEATRDGAVLRIGLSQGVPYRLFTLDDPRRLVIDFREVIWDAMPAEALLIAERVTAQRYGGFAEGWSRLVLDLGAPLVLGAAQLRSFGGQGGGAVLEVTLQEVSRDAFAASAGAPPLPGWDLPDIADVATAPKRQDGSRPITVVLDPGHGGIDQGAEADGTVEKALVLDFARDLAERLNRSGLARAVLTRTDDTFVPLETRVSLARKAGADAFVSLHADALSEGRARGATVHVLSVEASDAASAKLAERHDRGDILAGVDLDGQDDVVAGVLMDLARLENGPRSDRLARAIVAQIGGAKLPLNGRPLRSAGFSVLKAADIPSVLVELGFLSSARDRKNLADPAWRARMAEALAAGILDWAAADAAEADLIRQ